MIEILEEAITDQAISGAIASPEYNRIGDHTSIPS